MPIAVAVILGGLVGLAWGLQLGALTGAALAWLVVRSLRQERVIAELHAALQALPQGTTTVAEPAPQADRAIAAELLPVESPAQMPQDPPAPASADAVPEPAGAADPVDAPRLLRPVSTGQGTHPDLLAPIKAWLFGGNTIVKAGVAILFVGLAFLAKFASEHTQVPIEFRLAGIAAVAIVLMAIGWRLRLRRPGYAQVLQGGAIAALYLTLFAAFRLYGVLAVGPVFAMMVTVAALAAALAVLQDARALAVVGALGGFATPLLISTGSGDHVALFTYYLLLDLGIAAVAWYRTWRSLSLIGFLGTFVVATGWGVLKYLPAHYASSQAFLIAFFLLFAVILLMPRRPSVDVQAAPAAVSDKWVQGCLLFGLPTISFVLQHGLVRDTAYGTALSALSFAAFYVAMASWMRPRPRLALHFEASLAIATVFLTLVIPFALDARSTAGAWALEGAGLVWLGLRQERHLPRLFGYALLLLAGAAMAFAHDRHGLPTRVFNAYFFNGLMAAAASLAAAWFVQRRIGGAAAGAGGPIRRERLAEPLLIGWGTLWLLAAVAVQIGSLVELRLQPAAWLAALSLIGLLYTALSVRLDWPQINLPARAHAPLLMLAAVSGAASLEVPTSDGGWWAWPLALGVHAVVLWQLAPRWPHAARNLVHCLGVLVLGLLGALQGRATTADWGDAASAWPWLGWLVAPALLLFAVPHPAVARRWPVRAAPDAYRCFAALVLAIALLGWTLLANLASNGSAAPLPHLPLVNPLDLGVATAQLACATWWRGAADRPQWQVVPHAPVAALGVAGFVWINAMLIRGFHHFGGVPYQAQAWTHSLAVQTGITLLWTGSALVLMWWSARSRLREPWMVGAGLLAAVVLKLFLVDLSGSGTVTRIVSFIGVGALMLLIGYVAPLPARRELPHAP